LRLRFVALWFQSHNGAIAALLLATVTQSTRCFNPTMVRLLLTCTTSVKVSDSSFNPTMVRLLRHFNRVTLRVIKGVSIPQWCDCCALDLRLRFLAL